MSRTEELRDIVKTHGPVALAKLLVDDGEAHGISEHELTDAITAHAKAAHPGISPDAAFAKVFTASTDEGATLRKAVSLAKAASWLSAAPVFDPAVQVVGGEDARDVNDPSAALAALHEIGRLRWPELSEAQQFTRAFTDPKNAALAAKAHRRPSAV
jgi:hypothetical protein